MEDSSKAQQMAVRWGAMLAGALFVFGYVSTSTLGGAPMGKSPAVEPRALKNQGDLAAEVPVVSSMVDDDYQSSSDPAWSISVYNDYTELNPIQAYRWSYIAEPYRTTTLEVVSSPDVEDEQGQGGVVQDFVWEVDGHLQGYGRKVKAMFLTTGWSNVTVTALSGGPAANPVFIHEFRVMVKYVRREIRSLTDADREAWFNAVSVLQRVPTVIGQKLYGSKYYSKDYMNRLHLYYGGMADCDHWHQGSGFVTSHIAFTIMFEQSLQAVNPMVSMPYWDFTLESTFYEPKTWRESPVFSDDWFGAASPDNGLHTVNAGRFAYVSAMTNARDFSSVYNSYGNLRAPWNNDPTPFMTRSSSLYGYMNNLKPSGCLEYFVALRKNNWVDMSRQLNSAAHGHLHETVGGSWNHNYSKDAGHAAPAILTFAHEIQALSKELWRSKALVCPETCSMHTAWQDCQCQCDAEQMKDRSPYEILSEAGVLAAVQYYDHAGHLIDIMQVTGETFYALPGFSEEESAKIYDNLLTTLCNPGHIGSMFQATSANDITFWVLHPTLDRLWHWKRLANDSNYNETWSPTQPCYGHNPDDIQPFKNLFDEDNVYYSNHQLYNLVRPNSLSLDYVYDNFEWPHCETLGYDMSNLSV